MPKPPREGNPTHGLLVHQVASSAHRQAVVGFDGERLQRTGRRDNDSAINTPQIVVESALDVVLIQ